MNHNDILNFNGEEITIEDVLKKPTKVIVLGLYIKTQDLDKTTKRVCGKIDAFDEKIDNQWAKIGRNSVAISWIKGVLFVSLPLISALIGYLAYTR